jgi:glutamyl-tRNA(Gln) amidotransferase subunit E
MNSEYSELFETIVKESHVSPTTIAAFITETLKALKRDAVPVERITDNQLRDIFKSIDEGKLTKEALPDVLTWLCKNEDKTIQEAIEALGLRSISHDDLEKLIGKIVEDNKDLVKKRGEGSFGTLMGLAMNDLRGKADAAIVSKILKEKIRELAE